MPIKRFLYILLAVWAPTCAAQEYTLEFTRNPFTYKVRVDGEIAVEQNVADTAHTALYFITPEGAQYLDRPLRFDATETSLDADFATTDGRRAHLKIEPEEHGGFRLNLTFSSDDGVLGVGEMLRARPKENFHGLTERMVGNHDDSARDPSIPPSLDRRGHFVEMKLNGTISLYTPFYLSSRGYGIFVEGTWTGYFDMASRIGDRIQFEFDGPSLAYHVFLGDEPAEILEDYMEVAGRPLLPPRWGLGHYLDQGVDAFKLDRAVSAFSPIMEVGPTMNEAPWDMPDGTGYNAEAIAAWRTYVLLHKHLQDYTYEYARAAHQTGAPIMRPLFYEYPKDGRAWQIWDEFLYGEDVLIAPVLSEGARGREVYLPAGTWIDAWDPDRSVTGPATLSVDSPVYKTPIYWRSGAEVSLPDLAALYRESLELARQRPSPGDGSELR